MEEIIDNLRKKWMTPSKAIHQGEETIFRFICRFSPGIQINDTALPMDLTLFYKVTNGATLFEDVDYFQWGLVIYPFEDLSLKNEEIRTEREEFNSSELIIGEFLGDSDLLLIDTKSTFVIVATPILGRDDWFFLGISFHEFILRLAESEGGKFWES